MPPLVVSDASVCLKWFHEAGEEGVGSARRLLEARDQGRIEVTALDLTAYEIGNALVRGRRALATSVASVLEALADIVPAVSPTQSELALAAHLAEEHGLTFYDGAYAAVAQARGGTLVTFDTQVLRASLGVRPEEL